MNDGVGPLNGSLHIRWRPRVAAHELPQCRDVTRRGAMSAMRTSKPASAMSLLTACPALPLAPVIVTRITISSVSSSCPIRVGCPYSYLHRLKRMGYCRFPPGAQVPDWSAGMKRMEREFTQ